LTDPRLLVAGLLLVDSLYYIFARLLLPLVPPASGAMYMMVLGALQILLLMRGRLDWGVPGRHRWLFLTIGLLVGVNTNMGFVAVRYVDPGTASLLSRTSILFGVALGVLWLGERLRRLELVGAAIAISVAAVLVGLALAQGAVVWPTPVAWGWLLVAAAVNVVLSRGVYYLALRRLDMSLLTIILTLTPVVTWLWSVVLFGGRPTAIEIAGGVATLAGVLLVTASRAGVLAGGRPPARLDRRRGPG